MSGSDRGEGTEAVKRIRKLWPQPICNWLLALCVAFTAWFAPYHISVLVVSDSYDHKTSHPEYYQRECEKQEAQWIAFKRQNPAAYTSEDSGGQDDKAAYHLEHPNYCDLAAQYIAARAAKESAGWSAVGAGLAFIGVVAIIVTLWQAGEMLSEARKTTLAARKHSKFELRAYVSVRNISVHFENGGVSFADVILENHGQTPARDIKLICDLMFVRSGGAVDEKKWYFEVELSQVFPSTPVTVRENGSPPYLRPACREVYVVGCVLYADIYGEGHAYPFTMGKLDGVEDGDNVLVTVRGLTSEHEIYKEIR